MGLLSKPLDPERRAGLVILVTTRWLLIAAALFVINYRAGTSNAELVVLNSLNVFAAALNAYLQWLLVTGHPIAIGLPLIAGIYDAAGITAAIAVVDGFDNQSYVLYYPALLGFSLVFPGKRSIVYSSLVMLGYALIILIKESTFDAGNATDQKAVVLRLISMAATVLAANLVVRIERQTRLRAVAAEAERSQQLLAVEQRAIELERAANAERRRMSQEIHDGVSQGVYMLTLGLEAIAKSIGRQRANHGVTERLDALVRMSKQTLLETRHVLFDLEHVITGQTSLASLVRNQAREFSAVTGIAAEVEVEGAERDLPAMTVGEVYRIVQEGLANVYRHARATAVRVRLEYSDDNLNLMISDDGIGFDPERVSEGGHGLANMRSRVEHVGGDLAISSAPDRGTQLMFTVPYVQQVEAVESRGSDARTADV